MTDLDAIVARQLDDQPPVAVPPIAVVRRRAAQRRQVRAVKVSVLAVAAAGAAVLAVPLLTGPDSPDTVATAPDSPSAMRDAVQVSVCQAWPYNGGRRHCGTGGAEQAAEIAAAIRESGPAGDRAQGCQGADRDTPNVRISFADADGGRSDFRVVDCTLTGQRSGQDAAYAPDVARLAAARLTDSLLPADGSDREGCAAVIGDLAAFMAAQSPSAAPGTDANLLAQVLEHTIIEERAYLSDEQLATVERFYPEINNWLLGYNLDKALPSFEQGLSDLRVTCRANE